MKANADNLKRCLAIACLAALSLRLAADEPVLFSGTLFLIDGPGSAVSPDPANDSDGDGLPDDWETANGLDAADPDDAFLDIDGDGLNALDEYRGNTDPWDIDSDADLFSDADEPGAGPPPSFSGEDDAANLSGLAVFRP